KTSLPNRSSNFLPAPHWPRPSRSKHLRVALQDAYQGRERKDARGIRKKARAQKKRRQEMFPRRTPVTPSTRRSRFGRRASSSLDTTSRATPYRAPLALSASASRSARACSRGPSRIARPPSASMTPSMPPCDVSTTSAQASAPIVDLTLELLAISAVQLLQLADELLALTVDGVPIVVGQLAPLLQSLALKLTPLPFYAIPVHRRTPFHDCCGARCKARAKRATTVRSA